MVRNMNKYNSTYSTERLSAYAYSENDTIQDIITNYSNNIQISQAIYPELCILEVILRNAVDSILKQYALPSFLLSKDENKDTLPKLPVKGGVEDEASLIYKESFRYLDIEGKNLSVIEKTISLPPEIQAPISRGDPVGEAVYTLDGQRIGSVSILSDVTIEKAGYKDYIIKVWKLLLKL